MPTRLNSPRAAWGLLSVRTSSLFADRYRLKLLGRGKIMRIMLTQTRLNENSVLVRRLLNKFHQ